MFEGDERPENVGAVAVLAGAFMFDVGPDDRTVP
jgi:hypothetical protein